MQSIERWCLGAGKECLGWAVLLGVGGSVPTAPGAESDPGAKGDGVHLSEQAKAPL